MSDNGDLVLQICSDSVYVAEHVLHRVQHQMSSELRLVWCLDGHQRHTTRSGRVNRNEGRALIGFLDGTSNLKPAHAPEDRRLVFVDPKSVGDYPSQTPTTDPSQPNPYGGPQPPIFPTDLKAPPAREPDWTAEGTYLVIRGSVIDSTAWDLSPLGQQERSVGRWKYSGNALDQTDDNATPAADPNLVADPSGQTTPLTAHVRKTNPRGPGDADRRIFRRGYPLIATTMTEIQRGLVFICFGRTITTQFEFITRAWTANPDFPVPGTGPDALRGFERVLAGGYFFVPPLQRRHEPWSWTLPS